MNNASFRIEFSSGIFVNIYSMHLKDNSPFKFANFATQIDWNLQCGLWLLRKLIFNEGDNFNNIDPICSKQQPTQAAFPSLYRAYGIYSAKYWKLNEYSVHALGWLRSASNNSERKLASVSMQPATAVGKRCHGWRCLFLRKAAVAASTLTK